jgi:hypothetical protein
MLYIRSSRLLTVLCGVDVCDAHMLVVLAMLLVLTKRPLDKAARDAVRWALNCLIYLA